MGPHRYGRQGRGGDSAFGAPVSQRGDVTSELGQSRRVVEEQRIANLSVAYFARLLV